MSRARQALAHARATTSPHLYDAATGLATAFVAGLGQHLGGDGIPWKPVLAWTAAGAAVGLGLRFLRNIWLAPIALAEAERASMEEAYAARVVEAEGLRRRLRKIEGMPLDLAVGVEVIDRTVLLNVLNRGIPDDFSAQVFRFGDPRSNPVPALVRGPLSWVDSGREVQTIHRGQVGALKVGERWAQMSNLDRPEGQLIQADWFHHSFRPSGQLVRVDAVTDVPVSEDVRVCVRLSGAGAKRATHVGVWMRLHWDGNDGHVEGRLFWTDEEGRVMDRPPMGLRPLT